MAISGALLFACVSLQPCENTALADHPSPDGRWRIVVFERSCGATTPFTTQASLLRAGEDLPDEIGNLFVADDDHGAAPAGPGGGPEIRVSWDSADRVTIAHHPRARVSRAETSRSGISVRYRGMPIP